MKPGDKVRVIKHDSVSPKEVGSVGFLYKEFDPPGMWLVKLADDPIGVTLFAWPFGTVPFYTASLELVDSDE